MIIIRPHFIDPRPVFNTALRRQHQNRHILHLPHKPEQLEPVCFRQGDVQDYKLVIMAVNALNAVHYGQGIKSPEAVFRQGVFDGFAVFQITINNQNSLLLVHSVALGECYHRWTFCPVVRNISLLTVYSYLSANWFDTCKTSCTKILIARSGSSHNGLCAELSNV